MHPFIAFPQQPSGFTWTIASRISDALNEAERLYGERDKSFFFAGFEFSTDHPKLWFPGDRKHVVMQLGPTAKEDFPRAIYQLAHEVVHLLSPVTGAANVLEEGMAEHFAFVYAFPATGIPWQPDIPAYARARDLVRQLLALDPAAIRKARQIQPTIHLIIPELLLSVVPALPTDVAQLLTQPFVRQ